MVDCNCRELEQKITGYRLQIKELEAECRERQAATEQERERCATLALEFNVQPSGLDVDGNMGNRNDNWNHGVCDACDQIYAAIRDIRRAE